MTQPLYNGSAYSSADYIKTPVQHHHTPTAWELLKKLLYLIRAEKHDIWVLVVYSMIAGLFSLILPLSSQAIVNAVQLGVVTPQLIVLCIAVSFGMLVTGIFVVIESYLLDLIQRRLFVRAAFDIATRLPRIRMEALAGDYPPELMNRFFDVLTIQKSLSKMLLDGLSALLIALVGLILLAIYHPIFILFDFALFFFAGIVIFVLSYRGLETSIKESKKKYALVEWLEEIARSHTSFKLYSTEQFIIERVDHITDEYVKARALHFAVLARQLMGSAIFRAIASAGILGLGGFLVIEQSISIGQLVAAELVILSVLSSLEKLISQFDIYYDLLTAIDKISHITDKELEDITGEAFEHRFGPAALRFQNVHFAYPNGFYALRGVSFEIAPCSHTSIVGEPGSGKTTITNLLARLYEAQSGGILLNGQEIRHLRISDTRSAIGIVTTNLEIFHGTVRDNITLGRHCTTEEMEWALQTACVYDDIIQLPDGLNTSIVATGSNISESILCRIMIARAIIGRPQLLVIDEAFHTLDQARKLQIIDKIYACGYWTVLDISNDIENIRRSDRILVLSKGVVVESGTAKELAARPNSIFSRLFPMFSEDIRSSASR
ncbi:MAG: ABC transporter ATP-binding protein [Bacteroidota bacterium]|nr:ABC transporter ATP-binding protein/permease [Candidatus Kapabacteria bacterium]MDW8220084.1 ABC transporter ATP-binding protein [Bacteroidota bacterium]